MTSLASFLGVELTSDNLESILSDLGLLPVFIRRLLLKKYTHDILPSREQQIAYQKHFFKVNNIIDKDSLENWLDKNSITEAEMNLHLYRSLQIDILKSNRFSGLVESHFLEHKSRYDLVTFSLLRNQSRELVNELFIRLIEKEDTLSSLSSNYSEGSECNTNGLIGPIPYARLHPEISERLKVSKAGQLWQPFQVDSYWCIVRLERFLPSSLDSKTISTIENELFESWITSEVDDHLLQLQKPVKSFEIIDFTSQIAGA